MPNSAGGSTAPYVPKGWELVGKWWNDVSGTTVNNAYNAEQAEIQRRWQERLANTAIQRQTADAQAAGVNPLFAVGNGGAPVPSGAAASSAGASSGGPVSALAGVAARVLALSVGCKMMHSAQSAATSAGAAASVAKDLSSAEKAFQASKTFDWSHGTGLGNKYQSPFGAMLGNSSIFN